MTRSIHYLVRNPSIPGQVQYPLEAVGGGDYYGYGSFFMLGLSEDDIDDEYNFLAILGGNIMTVKLIRRPNSSTYRSRIESVGLFEFKATKIGVGSKYVGPNISSDGDSTVRQLAPRSHDALEKAAKDHSFYFVGFAPGLEDGLS